MSSFHRSTHEVDRTWHSRTLGYDRGGVLLSHDAKRQDPPPLPPPSAVSLAFTGEPAPPDPKLLGGHRAQSEVALRARRQGSDMDLAMHGVSSAASQTLRHHAQRRGAEMASLLSFEPPPAAAALDDPFAHVRVGGRRKAASQGRVSDPLALAVADVAAASAAGVVRSGIGGGEGTGGIEAEDVAMQAAYSDLMSAIDAAGGECLEPEYVFRLLAVHHLKPHSVEGAAELIDAISARGSKLPPIEFARCMYRKAEPKSQNRPPPALAPAPAPAWTASAPAPAPAPTPAGPKSIVELRKAAGGLTVANAELARLLNPERGETTRRRAR